MRLDNRTSSVKHGAFGQYNRTIALRTELPTILPQADAPAMKRNSVSATDWSLFQCARKYRKEPNLSAALASKVVYATEISGCRHSLLRDYLEHIHSEKSHARSVDCGGTTGSI